MVLIENFSQGTYSKEGDIVVLCAYLGQLLRVRDALSQEFTVVLDERDKNALDDLNNADGNEEPHLERVGVMQRVSIMCLILLYSRLMLFSGKDSFDR